MCCALHRSVTAQKKLRDQSSLCCFAVYVTVRRVFFQDGMTDAHHVMSIVAASDNALVVWCR
jgi:hypothetical protein